MVPKTNASKTKIIIFYKGKVRKFPQFPLDQDEIEVVFLNWYKIIDASDFPTLSYFNDDVDV